MISVQRDIYKRLRDGVHDHNPDDWVDPATALNYATTNPCDPDAPLGHVLALRWQRGHAIYTVSVAMYEDGRELRIRSWSRLHLPNDIGPQIVAGTNTDGAPDVEEFVWMYGRWLDGVTGAL